MSQHAVRCRNGRVHVRGKGLGNLLCVLSRNRLYIKCSDSGCGRWTELTINMPGVKLNLEHASIEQRLMPKDCRFALQPAPVVITGDE